MAFNIFKKKKEESKPVVQEPMATKVPSKEAEPAKKGATRAAVHGVLSLPHITEKASMLAEQGQYVFRVAPHATKGAVRQAVEAAYGVLVKSVRIQRKPEKTVRVGKKQGTKQGFKKAIVRLSEGQKIEVISR